VPARPLSSLRLKVFVDANLLIRAATGRSPDTVLLLMRKDLRFVASEYLMLEVCPKARLFGSFQERSFYDKFFSRAQVVESSPRLRRLAREEADRLGLGAMDALHLAAASVGGAHLLVTGEGRNKPMFSSRLITVRHHEDIQVRSATLL